MFSCTCPIVEIVAQEEYVSMCGTPAAGPCGGDAGPKCKSVTGLAHFVPTQTYIKEPAGCSPFQ